MLAFSAMVKTHIPAEDSGQRYFGRFGNPKKSDADVVGWAAGRASGL